MKSVLAIALIFNSLMPPFAWAKVESDRDEKPRAKTSVQRTKQPAEKSNANSKSQSVKKPVASTTKPADKSRANNKPKVATTPVPDVKPIVKASAVVPAAGAGDEEDDDDDDGGDTPDSQAKTSTASMTKEVTSESEKPTLRPSISKTEDDEDSTEEDDDEEGVGDPYLRYEKSKLKDQNCDPTILENFYRKSDYLGCITLGTAYCIQPTRDDLTWGFYGAAGGSLAGAKASLDSRKITRKRVLQVLDRRARTHASFTTKFLNGKSSKALSAAARPLFVLEREAGVARAVGGVVVRGGVRGAIYGFAGGLGVAAAMLVLDQALTNSVTPTACSERDETDPHFRKYVPLEKGTCHTPIYSIGAPQVREFMELPLKKKLEVLDSNPRICGFYRSMNEEMDKRIAELEGGSAVGKVTCDRAGGDITFSVRNDSKRKYKIKRKPETTELTSFEYAMQASPGVNIDTAIFDLVKTESGTELSKIQFSSVDKQAKTFAYDEFPKFQKQNPEKSQKLVHAFRTTRKHTPQLIKCCDKSDKELADPKNRHDCPPEWFAPEKIVSPASTPKTAN